MKGKIQFLLFYFLTWLAVFQIARLLFLLYHFSQTKSIGFTTAAQSFLYGLRMDLSMAAYLLLPVIFMQLLALMFPFFKRSTPYKFYSGVVLFFVLLIVLVDLEAYRQWGFRLDATPLKYISTPLEALASVSHLPLVEIVLLFVIICGLFIGGFNAVLNRLIVLQNTNSNKLLTAFVYMLIAAVLIIPIRGGLQLTPMNQSGVYFSNKPFANHAAINATWNFMQGALSYKNTVRNPYKYLPAQTAKNLTDSLLKSKNHTAGILKTSAPNVILIIWESFTEKALHQLVEGKEVTPNFNRLKSEGIYFSNLYASGDRTDKGLAAIISGYPALPQTSVLRDVNKAAKLPFLIEPFKSKGYNTPFYYGGEPEFANIKSYLLQGGFHPIIEKKHFAKKDQNSKWGAHDGVVAELIKKDLHTLKQPFFTTWLTLSSHEPFETPVAPLFKGTDHTTLFLNSLHYTDAVLNDFVQHCKQQTWWNNTLLIIVADHGHSLPESDKKEASFKIPMLWLGGALKNAPEVHTNVTSQLDIAATLLGQTGGATKAFTFSKNSFDTTAMKWAFFSFNDGWGFVQSNRSIIFDNVGKQIIEQRGVVSTKDIKAGKALQQYTYQNFLDK